MRNRHEFWGSLPRNMYILALIYYDNYAPAQSFNFSSFRYDFGFGFSGSALNIMVMIMTRESQRFYDYMESHWVGLPARGGCDDLAWLSAD